jgi:hypothetical protein
VRTATVPTVTRCQAAPAPRVSPQQLKGRGVGQGTGDGRRAIIPKVIVVKPAHQGIQGTQPQSESVVNQGIRGVNSGTHRGQGGGGSPVESHRGIHNAPACQTPSNMHTRT